MLESETPSDDGLAWGAREGEANRVIIVDHKRSRRLGELGRARQGCVPGWDR
jgi:hypothetical protein